MNPNQEQSSRVNLDAEYSQICNTVSRIAKHLKENPLTHLGAVQSIGAASSHLEVAAAHIDTVYRGAKDLEHTIMIKDQRIAQLSDIIENGQKENRALIERLNKPLSIDEIIGWFNSLENVPTLSLDFTLQIINALKAERSVLEKEIGDE